MRAVQTETSKYRFLKCVVHLFFVFLFSGKNRSQLRCFTDKGKSMSLVHVKGCLNAKTRACGEGSKCIFFFFFFFFFFLSDLPAFTHQ